MAAMLPCIEAFVMADKNTLRRCESMLRRLPSLRVATKPAKRNPMWSFLKGIEGFESNSNARAAECLKLLLDAQIDSMSVLKTATAQDLVAYAGLRPEDAVQIVDHAALREVSTPTFQGPSTPSGVSFALPWAYESFQTQRFRAPEIRFQSTQHAPSFAL